MSLSYSVLDAGAGRRVRPHGMCEVCGRVVQVLRDGTCRPHKPPGHHGWDADHAAADRELIAELEKLCQLMNEQNPDLAAVIVGATLRLKELTSA